MAAADLSLDRRKLPAAARDSCGRLSAFLCDFFERSTVAVERCLLSAQRLPPGNYDVDILRVQLDADTNALRQLRGGDVVPLPRKGSYTSSPRLVWLRIGRRISSTGFCVG